MRPRRANALVAIKHKPKPQLGSSLVVAEVGRRAEAQPSEHAGLEVNEDAKEAESDHTGCLFPSSRNFVKLS